jgi:hypothetical protein
MDTGSYAKWVVDGSSGIKGGGGIDGVFKQHPGLAVGKPPVLSGTVDIDTTPHGPMPPNQWLAGCGCG